jgi:hypothetical protein
LADAGAVGLVTTHDRDRRPAEDGGLTFDYRMKPGVVCHTNGLALMRAVGIDVPEAGETAPSEHLS